MRSTWFFTGSKAKRSGGFTLVEIVISIFILAVVLSTIYASFAGTFRITKSTAHSEKVYSMMRVTADRMLQDIESLSPRKDSYEISLTRGDYGDEGRELSFISSAGLSYVDGSASADARVRYYLTRETEEGGLTLWRSDSATVMSPERKAPRGFMICDGIKSIRYVLMDSSGAEHETWDSRSRSGKDKAPASVLVRIEFLNGEKPEGQPYIFVTRIAIPARS